MNIPALITFNMHDGTTIRWLCFAADVEYADGTFIDSIDDMLRFLTHSPAPDTIAVSIGNDVFSVAQGLARHDDADGADEASKD